LKLPPFPEITPDTLFAIVDRHGLAIEEIEHMPDVGIFNALYSLDGRYVLRIPRQQKEFIAATRKEALAAPAARAVGVRTPELIVFDNQRDILPVPYTIYEQIYGRTLGLLEHDPADALGVWREVGRDLARLHSGVEAEGPIAALKLEVLSDPRELPRMLAETGYFSGSDARGLERWLDRLAPTALQPAPRRFLHGDVQATNLIVQTRPLAYTAILDWGAAGWGDPAWDFAGMPLSVVPAMLNSYVELSPIADMPGFTARILWRQLQIGLFLLQREPQPTRSWAERPLGVIFDILRFLASAGEPWASWRP